MPETGDAGSDGFDDDSPIVIEPQFRRRPRGKGKPAPEAPSDVIEQTTDLKRARNVILDVNRYRMLLARRLANITLFSVEGQEPSWRDHPMASDPPQIQVLWQLRKELDKADAIPDEYQRTQCRTTLLKAMNDTVNKATEEAGMAAEQYRKIMESSAKLDADRRRQGSDINPADVYAQAVK